MDDSVPGSEKAGLIERLRLGDDAAFGELFENHEPAVRSLARRLASDTAEADDVTAETFFRVLQAVRRGSGPRDNVRAYLLTVARRVTREWRGSRRDVPVADDELTARAGVDVDWESASTEASLITHAFSSLPERWRSVLWRTEVEGEQPAVVASHFGLSANATAALARRARIGLRAAYLQAHLATGRGANGCRSVMEKLGGYTAGSVTGTEARKVAHHLNGCATCRSTHDELRQVCSGLRAHAGVLILSLSATGAGAAALTEGAGVGGATTYTVVQASGGGAAAGVGGAAGVSGAAGVGAAAVGTKTGTSMAFAGMAHAKFGIAVASTAMAAVTVASAPVIVNGLGGGGGADVVSGTDYAIARTSTDLGRDSFGTGRAASGSRSGGRASEREEGGADTSRSEATEPRGATELPGATELSEVATSLSEVTTSLSEATTSLPGIGKHRIPGSVARPDVPGHARPGEPGPGPPAATRGRDEVPGPPAGVRPHDEVPGPPSDELVPRSVPSEPKQGDAEALSEDTGVVQSSSGLASELTGAPSGTLSESATLPTHSSESST